MRTIQIESKRLIIKPKSIAEMRQTYENEQDPEMKQAYFEMLELMKTLPGKEEWGSDWNICLDDNTVIGGIGFKGTPDETGAVEIGYGIDPDYQRHGYATEAVAAMTDWVSREAGVKHVQAQTEIHNEISKKVLRNNHYVEIGVGNEGPLFEYMPACIIETKRLILRELTMDDLTAWHQILSDKETMEYYPEPFDLDKTRSWITWNLENYETYGFGLWAVILKDTNQFIGDCGITMQMIHGNPVPELGYHIDKKFWQNGYATEAGNACLDYVFQTTEFNEICSHQKYTNLPSRKVAEKCGMTFREEYDDNVNTKTSVYSVTQNEFYLK